jgi:hypothetical protein
VSVGLRVAAAAFALLAIGAPGCGKRGAPVAPEPRGPLPPIAVSVSQIGTDVVVRYTVPEPRGPGERQALIGAQLIRVSFPPGVEPSEGPDTFRRRGREIAEVASIGSGDVAFDPGARNALRDSRTSPEWKDLTGHTVRYGVRLTDRRGRRSPLVATPDLVPVAVPDPPTGIDAVAIAGGVRVRWDPVAPDAVYRVYRSGGGGPFDETSRTGAPIGATEFVDTEVELGTRYRYVVRTAYDALEPVRESADSDVAETVAVDRFAPARPTGLVAVQEGAFVRLFWDPAPERDLAGYRVERARDDGPWTPVTPELLRDPLFLDRDVDVGARLRYRVVAVDGAVPPNASEASEETLVVVAADPMTGGTAR